MSSRRVRVPLQSCQPLLSCPGRFNLLSHGCMKESSGLPVLSHFWSDCRSWKPKQWRPHDLLSSASGRRCCLVLSPLLTHNKPSIVWLRGSVPESMLCCCQCLYHYFILFIWTATRTTKIYLFLLNQYIFCFILFKMISDRVPNLRMLTIW